MTPCRAERPGSQRVASASAFSSTAAVTWRPLSSGGGNAPEVSLLYGTPYAGVPTSKRQLSASEPVS